jgi:hypothetical protein
LLQRDEYVSFSEQAYALGIVDYCQSHPSQQLCYGTGPGEGNTDGGPIEWLYYFGDAVQKVLPEAACPYKATSDEENECQDREQKLKTNPLSFKVKSIESAYSLTTIQQLLFTKNVSLTWGSVVATQTYALPCDQFDSAELPAVCAQCSFPVEPGYVLDNDLPDYSKCLSLLTMASYDKEGQFSLHGNPLLSGGHAMLLVGYNDEFIVSNNGGAKEESTTGGFILKNSWGTGTGHSVNYWTQKISSMEEALLCPDEASPYRWLPADVACMERQADVKDCSRDQYKRVRDQWVTGATVLQCANVTDTMAQHYGFKKCNKSMNYVLAATPELAYSSFGQPSGVWFETPAGSDGFIRVKLLEYDPLAPGNPATLVTTDDTTWVGLGNVLTPKEKGIGNDPEQCGYYFFPYQYFQEASVSAPAFGSDVASSVSYFDIEWDDSSYVANKESYPDLDFSYLEMSTHTIGMYTFDGPLDFEYNVEPMNAESQNSQ